MLPRVCFINQWLKSPFGTVIILFTLFFEKFRTNSGALFDPIMPH